MLNTVNENYLKIVYTIDHILCLIQLNVKAKPGRENISPEDTHTLSTAERRGTPVLPVPRICRWESRRHNTADESNSNFSFLSCKLIYWIYCNF